MALLSGVVGAANTLVGGRRSSVSFRRCNHPFALIPQLALILGVPSTCCKVVRYVLIEDRCAQLTAACS